MNEQQLDAELHRRLADQIAATAKRRQDRAQLRRQLHQARQHGLRQRHTRKNSRNQQ